MQAGFEIAGVVTAPDKPAHRGQQLASSPVKTFALEHGLHVLQPPKLKAPEFLSDLRQLKADVHIVVAFRMLPEAVWNMPPLGTYNLHASLLPQYRGAAPINWAIINGEKATGVTTFKLQHEIDTGSILMQEEIAIGPDETAGELHDRLMHTGAALLVRSMQKVKSGNAQHVEQQALIAGKPLKPAPKIFKEDCKIDWNRPAADIHNFVRGLSPFPAAYALMAFSDGQEIQWKVYKTAKTAEPCTSSKPKTENGKLYFPTSDYWVEIVELQAPGKKRMKASEFLKGLRDNVLDAELK